jgi:hypothetical protein
MWWLKISENKYNWLNHKLKLKNLVPSVRMVLNCINLIFHKNPTFHR